MKLRIHFTLVAVCVIVASCFTRDFKGNIEQFDSSKWKTHDLRERGRMTNDLLTRDLLKGRSSEEVRELLGEPDNVNRNGELEYETDPGAWLGGANNGPWIHYLHVDFGKPGDRVDKAYITD
jgi:hypothetical protein